MVPRTRTKTAPDLGRPPVLTVATGGRRREASGSTGPRGTTPRTLTPRGPVGDLGQDRGHEAVTGGHVLVHEIVVVVLVRGRVTGGDQDPARGTGSVVNVRGEPENVESRSVASANVNGESVNAKIKSVGIVNVRSAVSVSAPRSVNVIVVNKNGVNKSDGRRNAKSKNAVNVNARPPPKRARPLATMKSSASTRRAPRTPSPSRPPPSASLHPRAKSLRTLAISDQDLVRRRDE